MTKVSEKKQAQQPDETSVIAFLEKNPEVLMSHPDVFTSLSIPHVSGGVISLIEHQLKMLRKENKNLKSSIEELVSIARENEELTRRFQRLSMELMNGEQLHDLLAMVQDQVQTFFYTDYVCFRFLPEVSDGGNVLAGLNLEKDKIILPKVRLWLKGRKPICGQQDKAINQSLFGEDANIQSSAMLPLYHTKDFGLLCLGSTNANRFNQTKGTIFLEQLGELVSNRIKSLLK